MDGGAAAPALMHGTPQESASAMEVAQEQAQTRSGPLRSKSRRNKSDQRARVHANEHGTGPQVKQPTGTNPRKITSALERVQSGSGPEREESRPKVLHGRRAKIRKEGEA